VVTDIGLEKVAVPDPSFPLIEGESRAEANMIQVLRTKLENRTIQRQKLPTNSPLEPAEQSQTERIRGGGDDADLKMDVDAEHTGSAPEAATTAAGTAENNTVQLEQPMSNAPMNVANDTKPAVPTTSGSTNSLASGPGNQPVQATGAPIASSLPHLLPAPGFVSQKASLTQPPPAPLVDSGISQETLFMTQTREPNSTLLLGGQQAQNTASLPVVVPAPNPVPHVRAPAPVQVPPPGPGSLQPVPTLAPAELAAPAPVPLQPTPAPAPLQVPATVRTPVPLQPAPAPAHFPTPVLLQPAPPAPAPTPVQLATHAPVPLQPVPVVPLPKPVPAPLSLPTPATAHQITPSAQVNTRVSPTPGTKATMLPTTTASSVVEPKEDPVPVPSSTHSNAPVSAIEITQTAAPQSLATKPEPRWELHRPGPNDEMVTPEDQLTPKPAWYNKDGIADIERVMLPEWFDGSAPHRTPETYRKARETILTISDTISNRNVTGAMVRRSIVGDAGSLQRLRDFMSNWGLINEDAINDSTPTAPILREKYPAPKQLNSQQKDKLLTAVVEQSSKRQKLASDNSYSPIDWTEIALQVGYGVTAEDCERNFLSMPINVDESSVATGTTERPITPEVSSEAHVQPTKELLRQEFLRELVDSAHPEVVRKATTAALEATRDGGNLKQAQAGTLLSLVASRAVEEAQKTETQLEAILSQLLDQRMKKLENRMAMMDDVESILEAEKVALELERRDLYTARCRHWFGGT